MNKIFLIFCICILYIQTAFAQSRAEKRAKHQEDRIQQGIESGSVNEKEAERLQRGQERVQNAMEAAQSDGDISRQEKHHLNKMQNIQNRKIRRAKSN